MSEQDIIRAFPLLATDSDFKITSKSTPNYNCIAWACNYDSKWMQPPDGTEIFDGIYSYWPQNICDGENIECLIDVFISKGYHVCDTWFHEDGFQKVALYVLKGTKQWSHASRELMRKSDIGKWTSKLGAENDIQHGSPYTIEGDIYGEVYCIMKKEFK